MLRELLQDDGAKLLQAHPVMWTQLLQGLYLLGCIKGSGLPEEVSRHQLEERQLQSSWQAGEELDESLLEGDASVEEQVLERPHMSPEVLNLRLDLLEVIGSILEAAADHLEVSGIVGAPQLPLFASLGERIGVAAWVLPCLEATAK